MALDGAMISLLKRELCTNVVGARVDKIHMPSREEVIMSMRAQNGNIKLILSAKGTGARANLTSQSAENPKQPPMFCMLLRKYIGSSKITDIRQPELERILYFDFSGYDEFGDPTTLTLALEMMGRHSNIVLMAADGRIIDAARRVDASISSVRLVLPGLKYELPPPRGKYNLLTDEPGAIMNDIIESERAISLTDRIMELLQGVSPVLAREIAFEATGDVDTPTDALNDRQKNKLGEIFSRLHIILNKGEGKPYIITSGEGKPRDISFIPVNQYGESMASKEYPSYSELLDSFYSARDNADRFKQRSGDLLKLVATRRDRVARRIAAQAMDVEESLKRDGLRQIGDIISANLYSVKQGLSSVTLENFYDDGKQITIELDPKLTPSQNAQTYYTAYRKADTTYKKLTELIKDGELELAYLESVLDSLARARFEEEYDAIREELAENGIVRRRNLGKKQQKAKMKPISYMSSDGFLILSGRNNLENEYVTFKEAGKRDIWFHAQHVPGSHTVVFAQGKSVPNRTLEEAAVIAAYNSKLRDSSKVAVDYTEISNVKKIHGAGPGMVTYNPYQTAIVDSDENRVNALLAGSIKNKGTR